MKEPIFKSVPKNGKYWPGHNSFTVGEDNVSDV